MARDAVRKNHDSAGHQMAIELRDDDGPVLQVKFTFEIDRHSAKTSARPLANVTTRLEHSSHRGRDRLGWILPV
jgi:hypothetical protein